MKNACHDAAHRLAEILTSGGGRIDPVDCRLIERLKATGDRIVAFVGDQLHEDIQEYNRRKNVISLTDGRVS